MQFNPFDAPFRKLEADDLHVLCDVSEGWYVEYKRKVTRPSSIAKSISAFANQNGGWLFYGVRESDDERRVAQDFPGVAKGSLSSLQMKIRDAVAAHVDPSPSFNLRILPGPADNLSLESSDAVIAVRIPRGSNPPYVHSSGKIYRRIADRSDPTPETDRGALDRLWERGERSRQRLKEFLEDDPTLSEREKNTPILRLYLLRDKFRRLPEPSAITFDEFADIATDRSKAGGGLSCDNIYSIPGGYTARQIGSNDPSGQVLEITHYFDGTTVLTFPLRSYYPHQSVSHFEHYDQGQAFLDKCKNTGLDRKIIDLTILASILAAACTKHFRFCNTGGIGRETVGKARLVNVWRCVPYLGTDSYWEFINRYGIPLIRDSTLMAPPGTRPESLVEVPHDVGRKFNGPATLPSWVYSTLPITASLLRSTGMAWLVDGDDPMRAAELYSAVEAAQEAYAGEKTPT